MFSHLKDRLNYLLKPPARSLLCLLWIVLTGSGCFNSSKTMEEMQPYDGPLMELDSMETIYSDHAETRVRLRAKKQLALQNSNREFPEGVFVEFYDGQVVTSTLTSNYAMYYKESAKYMVSGNVIIKNLKEQKTLKTEELFWLPNEERIYVENDKQVIITTKTGVLYGKGLEAKEDFSSYKILHPTGEELLP